MNLIFFYTILYILKCGNWLLKTTNVKIDKYSESYSRGWRGAPAKGVGRVTGAVVQIHSTPPYVFIESLVNFKIFFYISAIGKTVKNMPDFLIEVS